MPPIRIDARGPLLGALLCTLSLAACGPASEFEPTSDTAPTATDSHPVVYGNDDRQDVYAHPDATLRLRAQQSTVALIAPSELDTSNPNDVAFLAPTLGEYEDLCSTERFRDDPVPAFCSGTLIDDDLVLTAGHCITDAAECADTRFVFNFYRTSATGLQTVTTQDIFSCKSIVVRRLTSALDYAIIRLDRPATPRFTPAPVRAGNTAMTAGANVTVIGSGSGIPFKIDAGGTVRDVRASTLDYFVASTDTFAGNSGSGVYEMTDYTVAGILVRGETDYVSNGSCNVANRCAQNGCEGEEITYVRPAITAYCAASTSMRLCGTAPPPVTHFTYSATSTNNATVNTVNRKVALTAGQKITLGTCGVAGASVTGDSFLRLYGPDGVQVGASDDACGGRGSNLLFTVPASGAGDYEVRAGCYANTSCGGTVAWTLTAGTPPPSGTLTFNVSNTNGAQQNTANHDVPLTAGQRITYGTCAVDGASGTGDTFLRLYNAAGTQVSFNDDGAGCGSLSSATYTVPAGAGGTYQLRAGCYANTSCGGTVAWTVQ